MNKISGYSGRPPRIKPSNPFQTHRKAIVLPANHSYFKSIIELANEPKRKEPLVCEGRAVQPGEGLDPREDVNIQLGLIQKGIRIISDADIIRMKAGNRALLKSGEIVHLE